MTTLVYETGGELLEALLKLPPSEVRVLCPKCRSELLFAPDSATAAKLKMHAGILCPMNWRHVSVTFSLK